MITNFVNLAVLQYTTITGMWGAPRARSQRPVPRITPSVTFGPLNARWRSQRRSVSVCVVCGPEDQSEDVACDAAVYAWNRATRRRADGTLSPQSAPIRIPCPYPCPFIRRSHVRRPAARRRQRAGEPESLRRGAMFFFIFSFSFLFLPRILSLWCALRAAL